MRDDLLNGDVGDTGGAVIQVVWATGFDSVVEFMAGPARDAPLIRVQGYGVEPMFGDVAGRGVAH
jgi:hypothetical protein